MTRYQSPRIIRGDTGQHIIRAVIAGERELHYLQKKAAKLGYTLSPV